MDRPNTVAGLQAKRDELLRLHAKLIAESKSVIVDLAHVEATIRLFDPNADLHRIGLDRYAPKLRAPKGQLQRFVLNMLRTAERDLTSREITEAWIKTRHATPDERVYLILRKRVGACLTKLQANGIVVSVPGNGDFKLWRIAALEA